MKKIHLIVLCLAVLPLFAMGQVPTEKGILFEQGLTWEQVKAKAKKENKLIFLDLYATWCGPCKQMDQEVYTDEKVGEFFNGHYISVRIQCDSTSKDNDYVRSWYAEARNLRYTYKISAYPSYLFFSAEGKPVHKYIGAIDTGQFKEMGHNVLDPDHQYYTKLERFRRHELPFTDMPKFINFAQQIQEKETANLISKTYIDNYLLKQPTKSFTPVDLNLVSNLIYNSAHGSQENAFHVFYKLAAHANPKDTAARVENFARDLIDAQIQKEEIFGVLYRKPGPGEDAKLFTTHLVTEHPDWNAIHSRIFEKYTANDADRVVMTAKVNWLKYTKHWTEYCENLIKKVKVYGPFRAVGFDETYIGKLNSDAWELFTYSTNQKELEQALNWSNEVVNSLPTPNAEYLDTYANLLYKLGKKEEALGIETKANILDPGLKDIAENLVKMQKGEQTWPNN